MFWKNADTRSAHLIRPFYSSFFSSITARLTFLYILSAVGTLVLATGFLYWSFVNRLERKDSQFLADNIRVMRVILMEHAADRSLLWKEVQWEGPAHRSTRYFVRVLDGKGMPMVETPDIHDTGVDTFPFPSPANAQETPAEGALWVSRGVPYLLMSAYAESGSSGRGQVLLQIALDVSHTMAAAADYRRTIIIVLFCGVLFSAIAGVAVARRGMRPLKEITRAIHRITSTQLHERIGTKRWPNELTALAAAFDGMLDRLEDSFDRLSRFSADLAHELRTPINVLMGESEVALSRTRTPEEYRHVLESGIEEHRKLSRLIDDLLFLARAENTKITVAKSVMSASQEIDIVRQYYQILADEQGIEVTCSGDVPVKADPALFQRAMSNLLSNGLKYTPAGGRITIEVRQPEDRSFTEISVSDTGEGIPPRDLPHVFDRFFRSEPARKLHSEGAGLGLSIVKSIMELHGGTVSASSEPKKGTTIALRFPFISENLPKMTKL